MKRTIAAAILAVGALAGTVSPASASPARVTAVAPITCAQEDSCVLDYNGNPNGGGYWMARQSGGSTWVRLTLVPGWSTTGVAPITCAEEDSCVLDYTSGYWRARQSAGTVWVRLTLA